MNDNNMNDNNQEEDYSNPDDFSYSQLFQLLGLNYDSDGEDPYGNLVTPQVIKSSSEERILQFQNAGNKQLESFFVEVEDKLLQEYKTDWGENDKYDQYHDDYDDDSNVDSVSSVEDNMEEINQVEDETNEMEKQEEEGDDEDDDEKRSDDDEDEKGRRAINRAQHLLESRHQISFAASYVHDAIDKQKAKLKA